MLKRRIGLFLLLMGLVALLAACDAKGLPEGQPAQPTTEAGLLPTPPERVLPTITAIPTIARRTPTTEATTESTSEPEATGTALPPGTAQARIDLQVIEIEQDAEKVRGLTAKTDVPETFISKDQMRANITKLFEEEYSRKEAQQDATELWLLRLIDDPKMDLYQLQLDLHSDVVLGYYDPKKDDLYVLKQGDALSAQSRSTIAHEFVHSLQDEYFDLQKLLPDNSVEYDRDTAIRALVEGDAVSSEIQYVRKYFTPDEIQDLIQEENSGSSGETLKNAPRYIRESLYFPYIQGNAFAEDLRTAGGFKRIDTALADPPQSTEQILHPEKYTESPRDNPIKVSIPPLTSTLTTLAPDWKYIGGGSFGEFDLQLMLKINGVSDSESDRAAAGWGGAWYVQYQSGDTSVLALDTQWDTSNDADEFDTAMGKSFRSASKEGDLWVQDGRYFSVTQNGKRVLYLAATDRKALEAAKGALK